MMKSVSLNRIVCFRWVVAFIIGVLTMASVSGQEIWTTNQFLDFEQKEREIPYQESLNFLNNKAKGMPFVDRVEFRTETDEMEFERQQYQFRFKFNSSDERKAYDRILLENKNKYSWLQSQVELKVWEEKYKNILDLYFFQKEMQLVQQDLELLYDRRKVLKRILDSNPQVDVEDWISNEEEIFNVLSDSLELELQKKEIALKIFGSVQSIPRLDESDFIQIESLNRIVMGELESTIIHPESGLALVEEKLADAEFKLEVAESKRWLEFAQIQYKAEDKLSFQKEISFGTSITIPNGNNNRIKKNEAALELLEKRYKTNIEQEENKEEILFEKAKLMSLIDQLSEYRKIRENQKLNSIFDSYSEKKIVSPLVLIGIKRSIVRNTKKQLDLEKDIYQCYIDLLAKKAAFLSVPRKNYLSER